MSDTQQGVHGEHDRPSFQQHHFESAAQQFDSAKFGMWLFLATEVLLFGGLFCAYAIYRTNHPEVFIYAHQFLDKNFFDFRFKFSVGEVGRLHGSAG